MSDFLKYLQSKIKSISLFLLLIAAECLICWLYGATFSIVLTTLGISLFVSIVFMLFDFFSFKNKLHELRNVDSISISEYEFKTNDPIEEELYSKLINECEKSKKSIEESEQKFIDATDYFTMWMHQIKTPISGISLISQNIEDEELSNNLKGEITDINEYVDMVLNYLRLGSETKDLVFEKINLDKVIKSNLRKFANHFFAKNIAIDYEPGEYEVLSDEKWISFVVGQILSNALKYSHSGAIHIKCSEKILSIRDEGIGIASEDLPRVFEKGYTGYNGRVNSKSTGIGLYLVKQVCDMIGVEIEIQSKLSEGTCVNLKFNEENINVSD